MQSDAKINYSNDNIKEKREREQDGEMRETKQPQNRSA